MPKLTLLYAEDDQETRENYSYILRQYFKEVYSAKNGEEALKLYYEHQPDVLLLDISMPIIDGLELARIVREKNEDIPIIIMTAHSQHDKLLAAINLRLEKYLLKPIDDTMLYETIKKLQKRLDRRERIPLSNELYWNQEKSMFFYNDLPIKLTKKENLLVGLLSSEIGTCFSHDAIIAQIWHDEETDVSHDNKLVQLIYRLNKKMIAIDGYTQSLIDNNYALGYKLNL